MPHKTMQIVLAHAMGHLSWIVAFIAELRFAMTITTELVSLFAGTFSLYILVRNNTSLFKFDKKEIKKDDKNNT